MFLVEMRGMLMETKTVAVASIRNMLETKKAVAAPVTSVQRLMISIVYKIDGQVVKGLASEISIKSATINVI